MEIEVIPVHNHRELEQFIHLPWQLYQEDRYWVAPLLMDERKRFDPSQNPFFEHAEVQLLLALQRGEPVGRISVHIDTLHNEFHGEQTGFFGFFEVAQKEAAQALLEAAKGWLKRRGMKTIRGPFSFNSNGESGLLIQGFDSLPALMMPYNPPHYAELIEGCGFTKAKDLWAYVLVLGDEFRRRIKELEPRLASISQRALRQGVTIRNVNLKDFQGELKRLMEIYNEAWERNWGFVPLTEKEFMAQAEQLKRIVVPELAKIAELAEEPIGFGLALPDFNQALHAIRGQLFPFGILKLLWKARRIDGLRMITLGVKRSYRRRGVDALLYLEMLRAGLSLRQYKTCECSWVLEDNDPMNRALALIGGQVTKVYRVYEKSLQ